MSAATASSTSFDIVELIEHHPITKLSETYNVRLLEKIKSTFTETEQQLFVTSFYCYLNHDTQKEFVVDLDEIWRWMGFQQKQHAMTVLERHFKVNDDYKTFAFMEKKANVEDKPTGRGGHNIKKVMLTIRCFKSLCLKAQTKKAAEIHEYYLKLEELLHQMVEEECSELKQKLQEQKRLLDEKTEELKVSPEIEKHRVLLKKFGTITGGLVYLMRVSKVNEDGTYILKIGESRRGLKQRYNDLRSRYGPQLLIMDCFPVHHSSGLEKFLHHHSLIHPHRVDDMDGHESEKELFKVGNPLTYAQIIAIIEENIHHYDLSIADYEALKLENERLRLASPAASAASAAISQDVFQKMMVQQERMMDKLNHLESIYRHLASQQASIHTTIVNKAEKVNTHYGGRVQKIHPESRQIMHVYDSIAACIKVMPSVKRNTLSKAIRENTIYCGFRWQLVDREVDPYVIHELLPTRETKPRRLGYVAKVNEEQTAIVAVYLNRKTACHLNGYKTATILDNNIKHHTLRDGHYYQLLQDCKEEWIESFQQTHTDGKPILLYTESGVGQFDENHRLLQEFPTKYECALSLSYSQTQIGKVLDTDTMYKGFYFKQLPPRLSL